MKVKIYSTTSLFLRFANHVLWETPTALFVGIFVKSNLVLFLSFIKGFNLTCHPSKRRHPGLDSGTDWMRRRLPFFWFRCLAVTA